MPTVPQSRRPLGSRSIAALGRVREGADRCHVDRPGRGPAAAGGCGSRRQCDWPRAPGHEYGILPDSQPYLAAALPHPLPRAQQARDRRWSLDRDPHRDRLGRRARLHAGKRARVRRRLLVRVPDGEQSPVAGAAELQRVAAIDPVPPRRQIKRSGAVADIAPAPRSEQAMERFEGAKGRLRVPVIAEEAEVGFLVGARWVVVVAPRVPGDERHAARPRQQRQTRHVPRLAALGYAVTVRVGRPADLGIPERFTGEAVAAQDAAQLRRCVDHRAAARDHRLRRREGVGIWVVADRVEAAADPRAARRQHPVEELDGAGADEGREEHSSQRDGRAAVGPAQGAVRGTEQTSVGGRVLERLPEAPALVLLVPHLPAPDVTVVVAGDIAGEAGKRARLVRRVVLRVADPERGIGFCPFRYARRRRASNRVARRRGCPGPSGRRAG